MNLRTFKRNQYGMLCSTTLGIFSLLWGISPSTSLAYPVLISAKETPNLLGKTRNNLIAIAPDPQGAFRRVPLQIEEVEDGAALVFRHPTFELPLRKEHPHPSKRDPFADRLDEVHRISVDDENFGICNESCTAQAKIEAKKLCKDTSTEPLPLTRVDLDFKKTAAFLVACSVSQRQSKKLPVRVDIKNQEFVTPTYKYKYKGKRNILFDEISLMPENKAILKDSELMVYLKPKYVFNMQFGENDIVSRITSVTQGSVSTGVEVAFSLDVLSFKVNSQICCDMSIYNDAFYFPVMLDLPFEGNAFKAGSGLYYGLNAADKKIDQGQMKFMARNLSDYKFEDNKAVTEGGASAILIKSDKKLVAVGFRNMKETNSVGTAAPLLAKKADLKKIEFPDVKSDMGLFYDITTLAKGFHNFNVWFYVGDSSQEELLSEYAQNGIRFKITPIY